MTIQNAAVTQHIDIDAIKAKHKATWEDGNYADFATYMHDGALDILHGWDFSGAKTLLISVAAPGRQQSLHPKWG